MWIHLKSIVSTTLTTTNTRAIDEHVMRAVRHTPLYVEGCRHPSYVWSVPPAGRRAKGASSSQQMLWVSVTDHLMEMERSQLEQGVLVGDPHPHAWTLWMPLGDNTVMDVQEIEPTTLRLRVFPTEGVLISKDDERLFQIYVHTHNDVNKREEHIPSTCALLVKRYH